MAPSLHISAGKDKDNLSPVAVNHDDKAIWIDSPSFRGRATVRIKDFTGFDPEGVEHKSDSSYFNEKYRKGITWSIQIQGRFLKEVNTNDVVFGNQFDKPIKDHLPYGTSVALQFVKVIDPNLTHDLYADKPWAFSPFIATLTHLNIKRLEEDKLKGASSAEEEAKVEGYPAFPSTDTEEGKNSIAAKHGYTVDDTSALVVAAEKDSNGEVQLNEKYKDIVDRSTFLGLKWPAEDDASDKENLKARKTLFGDQSKRKQINLTPQDVWTADFCNGFIDFNTLNLHIPVGGLSFDLKRYYNNQPVQYQCKNKETGEVYFMVTFDIQEMNA